MKLLLIALCLGLASAHPTEYPEVDDNLILALSQVKNFLNTDHGIEVARDFIRKIDDGHPVVFIVKNFVASSTNTALKQLLSELMKDIPKSETNPTADIHSLFVTIHRFLITDVGPTVVKHYFEELQTTHPIAVHVKNLIVQADEEDIREILDAVLPDVYYYSAGYAVRDELKSLFGQIRAILITPEGLEAVKDYARAVEPTHPVLFLVKAFIQSADDAVLFEILDEVFKNFSESVVYESAGQKLERLFMRVREIIHTEEGYKVVKDFLTTIKSEHPIVNRIHAFISQASDETLREILDALFGDA